MRALVASLGAKAQEEMTILPARGVVAELDFLIDREGWKKVDIAVQVETEFEG